MPIQAVGNSQIAFKSSRFNLETAFVNMDDEQLRYLVHNMDDDKEQVKKDSKKIANWFYAVPVVSTIASGLLAKKINVVPVKFPDKSKRLLFEVAKEGTSLAERTSVMGTVAALWAVAILGVAVYNKGKKVAEKKSESVKQFNDNHPLASFVADIGIILGGFILGAKGLGKITESIAKKSPEVLESVGKAKSDILNCLDKSHFNKSTLAELEKEAERFSDKLPNTAGVIKFLVAASPFIAFGVWAYKALKYHSEQNRKFENNYNDLKDLQLDVAKHLVNKLGVEKDILAQGRGKLVKDFEKSFDKGAEFDPEDIAEVFFNDAIIDKEKFFD